MKSDPATTRENIPSARTCRVCGDALFISLPKVTDPVTREIFSIGQCRNCGLAQTLPRPDKLDRYYGERYYGNRHGLTDRLCIKRRLGWVRKAAGKNTTGRLLDVGCGDGSFLLAARAAGWDVAGVEINPEPARRAGLDIVEEIHQARRDAPYDCITLWHSLEHMRDINGILGQLPELLSRDGTVIIAVPNKASLQAKIFRQEWLPLDVPRHLYHFDPRSLSHGLEENGLTVQRVWFQEFEYDLMGWAQSALHWIFPEPIVFIERLMGKPTHHSPAVVLLNLVLGMVLSALALPLVLIERIFKRSGTIILAAKPDPAK